MFCDVYWGKLSSWLFPKGGAWRHLMLWCCKASQRSSDFTAESVVGSSAAECERSALRCDKSKVDVSWVAPSVTVPIAWYRPDVDLMGWKLGLFWAGNQAGQRRSCCEAIEAACAARLEDRSYQRQWMGEDKENNNLQRVPRVHKSLTSIFWWYLGLPPTQVGGEPNAFRQKAWGSRGKHFASHISGLSLSKEHVEVSTTPDPQLFTSKFTTSMSCSKFITSMSCYYMLFTEFKREEGEVILWDTWPWPLVCNCCCWRSALSHCNTKLRNKKWMHRSASMTGRTTDI